MINVGVVGLGHWGPNIARNIAGLSDARLHALCDSQDSRLSKVAEQYPSARAVTDFYSLIMDPELDAVVIATPVHSHFELARAALQAAKHVMVEKPLAQTAEQCRELIEIADSLGVVLMTGHVFVYNAAVRKAKEYIDTGQLGEVYYVYSQRLNLGIVRKDVNALWNFAPHDVSILNYWLGSGPKCVLARGYSYLQPGIEDVVFLTLDYPDGVGVSVHVSWLNPLKLRRMTVVGSEKMLVYDDVSAEARIAIYDKGITRSSITGAVEDAAQASLGEYRDYGEFQLLVRAGDVWIPKLDFTEPLRVECQHFVECVRGGARPVTDGTNGLEVVRVLEAAQQSLFNGGTRVELE